METKRGLGTAVQYLKDFQPIWLVPETLCKRAGCDIMIHTLSHSLRRLRRTGEVLVKYLPDNSGQKIAYYAYNPDYTPKPKSVKREDTPGVNPIHAIKPPPLFFYALNDTPHIFSPYYMSKESLMAAVNTCAYKIFTGSHENPIAYKEPI